MRIYKMTATFGKLQGETLTLEPGLNIITAKNEWGKSTWCAFLIAMLYGMDTRTKTTKTALADKERYAPWSGMPMEGRMDISWNGRDITIERRTRRRMPLGEFHAYETESGLPVEELNAGNCGELLLGVEQSVFRRAGFIRQADLPLTQDEALRRRLNNLVTTGDESGAGDRLAENLKNLKNTCRYNRSGLLPQAEREREELYGKLEDLNQLEDQCGKLRKRLEELQEWEGQLKNHAQALKFVASQENAQRLTQAKEAMEQTEREAQALEEDCAKLPAREEADQKVKELRTFREAWNALQMDRQLLPQRPEEPQLPPPFTGMSPEDARHMVQKDGQRFESDRKAKAPTVLLVLGLLGFAGAVLLLVLKVYIPAAMELAAALAAVIWSLTEKSRSKKQREALYKKYGSLQWQQWGEPIDAYEEAYREYREDMKAYQETDSDVDVRGMMLQKKREALCGAQEPEALLDYWQQVQQKWDCYHTARRESLRAKSHYEAMENLVRPVEPPSYLDTLTYSEQDTARLLSDCNGERQHLVSRLGQYQGRMEALGSREALEKQLTKCSERIAHLEETYAALSIAMETLADARAELQRRFAPRISKRAQSLLSAMTDGRYHSLTMGEDFSLQAGAGEEATLRDSLWRSDGTMDQLYLSLRLAVAEELTPEAPLVLDDALVRFDDERMTAAVKILKEMAQTKQVICFTCQNREAEAAAR